MSGGRLDVGCVPYGNNSNSFDVEASESGYDSFNNIANCWNWKVDIVLILVVIAINMYI